MHWDALEREQLKKAPLPVDAQAPLTPYIVSNIVINGTMPASREPKKWTASLKKVGVVLGCLVVAALALTGVAFLVIIGLLVAVPMGC